MQSNNKSLQKTLNCNSSQSITWQQDRQDQDQGRENSLVKRQSTRPKRLTSDGQLNSLSNSRKELKSQQSNSLIRPRPTMILDQRSDGQEDAEAHILNIRLQKSRNQSRLSDRNEEKTEITEVSSLKSLSQVNKTETVKRKTNVLTTNFKRLERLLHKTTKETESAINYNKLLRTENKVDRLIRKKKEIASMNPREKIEMEIISTDPKNYTNVMTETQKIELHRVNDYNF